MVSGLNFVIKILLHKGVSCDTITKIVYHSVPEIVLGSHPIRLQRHS